MMSLLVLVVVLYMMMLRRMELRNNMMRRRRRKNQLICLRQGNLILIVVLVFLNKVGQLCLLSSEKLLFTLIIIIPVLNIILTSDLIRDLTMVVLDKESLQYIVTVRLALRLRQLGGQTAQDGVHHTVDLLCVLLTDEPPQDGAAGSLLRPAPGLL